MSSKIEWTDLRKGSARVITTGGYIRVYCPGHPSRKNNKKAFIYEHRYVMECYLKKFLKKTDHVHHKNGIHNDNRIENLELIDQHKHAKIHSKNRSPELVKKLTNNLLESVAKRKQKRVEIFCKCGCGKKLITPDSKCRHREYIKGHNSKGKNWKWHRKQK